MEFGQTELEQLLFSPLSSEGLDRLTPWVGDAWSIQFPDLSSLAGYRHGGALRVCIATEDIVGPVRNGGIGTTYAALADLLVADGHHVTILYLLGQEVETGDASQWVEFYAEKGIDFVPVSNYALKDGIRSAADRWLRAPYNLLRFLSENPMDVVHASEWRGAAYLSLLAKRQGWAFADTLFLIKTSSPWMWSRLYGSQPLNRLEDLAKMHAERQSVELADMVIGGSLHLLRWMISQGYRIPRARTFVQPNVATFEGFRDLIAQRPRPAGTRIPVDEFVFFGRLEARKGLFIFCQAIRRLIRLGVPLPPRISFMGKPGAKLTARPNQGIVEYIEEETRDWPTRVQIITQFPQYEAIQYLLQGPRLAVMPSIIENSSMTIYETAICGIPCVASASGGNPELLADEDRAHVLCEAHPVALADKLRETLEIGGYIPRPSFDNDANLQTWRNFHRSLAGGLGQELREENTPARDTSDSVRTSVCVYFTGQFDLLRMTLESLKEQTEPAFEVLVALDAEQPDADRHLQALAADIGIEISVIEASDRDAGAAFTLLARAAGGDFLLFLWEGATLRSFGLRVLNRVAQASGGDVFNYFHRVVGRQDVRPAPMRVLVLGSSTDSFYRTDVTQLPLCVRRQTFLRLDGFSSDYRVLCAEQEFVAKAQMAGVRCETVLTDLGTVLSWDPAWLSRKGYDVPVSQLRAIRPNLAAVPLGLRDLLLISKGFQLKNATAGRDEAETGSAARPRTLLRRLSFTRRPSRSSLPAAASPVRHEPIDPALRAMIEGGAATGAPPVSGKSSPSPAEARSAVVVSPRLGSNLVRRGSIAGQLLAVRDGALIGWICDLGDPGRHLGVVLTIDGEDRDVYTADGTVPLAVPPSPEIEGHCFSIPLPSGPALLRPVHSLMTGLGRPPEPGRYGVRSQDGVVLADSRVLPPPGATLASMGIEGFCDPSDDGVFRGWAWRPNASDRRLDIAIFVDGKLLARVTASRYREDVHHAGYGDGEYGFDVTLPAQFRDGKKHSVEAIVADIGLPLGRSPLSMEGQRLAFEHKKKGWMFR